MCPLVNWKSVEVSTFVLDPLFPFYPWANLFYVQYRKTLHTTDLWQHAVALRGRNDAAQNIYSCWKRTQLGLCEGKLEVFIWQTMKFWSMWTRIMKVCREEKKANRVLQDRSFSSRCIYFACFAQCLYQDQRKVVLEVHYDRKKEKTFSPSFHFVFRSSDDHLCFVLFYPLVCTSCTTCLYQHFICSPSL